MYLLQKIIVVGLIFGAMSAYAETILDTLIPASRYQGGFWVGSMDFGPGHGGITTYKVAQTFGVSKNYSNVAVTALLSSTNELHTVGGVPLVVRFSLAVDSQNQLDLLSSIEVSLDKAEPTTYQLAFSNLQLVNGRTYWLIAESDLTQYTDGSTNCCAGSLPVWAISNAFTWPQAFSRNSDPWVFLPQTFAFAVYGESASEVPEPTSMALIIIGLPLLLRRTISK